MLIYTKEHNKNLSSSILRFMIRYGLVSLLMITVLISELTYLFYDVISLSTLFDIGSLSLIREILFFTILDLLLLVISNIIFSGKVDTTIEKEKTRCLEYTYYEELSDRVSSDTINSKVLVFVMRV